MNKLQVLVTIVSSILSGASFAGVVTFHPESAVYAGNGCPQGSTQIIVDEAGDLLVEHSQLALNLPAHGSDAALAGRKACAIRVPLNLPHGFFVKSIEQRLQYSVIKSANAEARIATRTAISGDNINPFTVVLPRGDEIIADNMIDSRRDSNLSRQRRAQYCSPDRTEDMMLQINVAISGQRDSTTEDLVVAAHGGYVGEGFEIEVESCEAPQSNPVHQHLN